MKLIKLFFLILIVAFMSTGCAVKPIYKGYEFVSQQEVEEVAKLFVTKLDRQSRGHSSDIHGKQEYSASEFLLKYYQPFYSSKEYKYLTRASGEKLLEAIIDYTSDTYFISDGLDYSYWQHYEKGKFYSIPRRHVVMWLGDGVNVIKIDYGGHRELFVSFEQRVLSGTFGYHYEPPESLYQRIAKEKQQVLAKLQKEDHRNAFDGNLAKEMRIRREEWDANYKRRRRAESAAAIAGGLSRGVSNASTQYQKIERNIAAAVPSSSPSPSGNSSGFTRSATRSADKSQNNSGKGFQELVWYSFDTKEHKSEVGTPGTAGYRNTGVASIVHCSGDDANGGREKVQFYIMKNIWLCDKDYQPNAPQRKSLADIKRDIKAQTKRYLNMTCSGL